MRLALTAGDPAGVGLEILVRVLPRFLDRAQWILFGEPGDFESALQRFQPTLGWSEWKGPDTDERGLWFSAAGDASAAVVAGRGSEESGRRALLALTAAAEEARRGRIDGIVTAPLAKRWAGGGFTGQTEFLRDHSGTRQVAMSFFTPSFKVVLATTHMSLRSALAVLSQDLYRGLIALTDREIRALGYPGPRIAVAGVNPHAGEHGMFGTEEDDVMAPAIQESQALGFDVSGPWPADTCYPRAHAGEFDVVVAPYHDQGLIPVKLIASGASANVTLGLPYVRTSPDHGTAFEIAGKGIARTEGMESAMEWALELVTRRHSAQSQQVP